MSSNSTTSTQENAVTATTSTFLTSLGFNAIVFAAEISAFTILRPHLKSIYEPRVTSILASKRVPPLGGMFLWPWTLLRADYRRIKQINGMDAYFFLRFLRMMIVIMLPIWALSWITLLPVYSVGTYVSGKDGLDKYSFGNISPNRQGRYWGPLVLTWVYTIWIWHNIRREMRHFIIARQQYLIDPVHARSVQARTVLITGIPSRYLSQESLRKMYSHLPGGVKTIWINRDLNDLPAIFQRRQDACAKLESAQTDLMRTAAKLRLKKIKAESNDGKTPTGSFDPECVQSVVVPKDKRPTHRLPPWGLPFGLPFLGEKVDTIEWATDEIAETNKLLDKERQKMTSGGDVHRPVDLLNIVDKVPVVGDIFKTRRSESAQNPWNKSSGGLESTRSIGGTPRPSDVSGRLEVPKESEHGHGSMETNRPSGEPHPEESAAPQTPSMDSSGFNPNYPPLNSAFITFYEQTAAHLAVQALAHHEPYRMSGRHIEVAPEDVIWSNLGLNPYEAKVRIAISYALTVGLVIVWAIPVAFIGAVSNVDALCVKYHWLAWVCRLPKVVVGVISGVLPPVLLAVLNLFLPIVLRLFARFEGVPKQTGVELSLMTRYFIFQVIHNFLIVTISSGLIAALPSLVENPSTIPAQLATKLPQASIFFLTYVVLQGLSGSAGGFLQVVKLVLYYVKLILLGSTPRAIYNIKYVPGTINWGTVFPSITLIVVITFGYSTIAPVINGLATVTFFLFYMLYKYLFTWVLEQPASSDTGGLFFPKAIQHMFVGMYVQQICLAALFFLARDQNNNAGAVPEGALMIVLLAFTAFFHILISDSFGPLIHFLPMSLADRTFTEENRNSEERHSLLQNAAPNPRFSASSDKEKGRQSESDNIKPNSEKPQEAPINAGAENHEHDKQPQIVQTSKGEVIDYGFAQPAASRPQPIIWFPKDTLGFADEAEATLKAAGIDVTTKGAEMDEFGHVKISTAPPGLEASN